MLNISKNDVVSEPFPHVISQEIIVPELYQRLRADFPRSDVFEDQLSKSGIKGSRTGSGFDIYRGDAAYDNLIEKSDAWAEFDAFINSTRFIDKFLEVFGEFLNAAGCRYPILSDRYDHDLIEGRETLTEHATLKERVSGLVGRMATRHKNQAPRLFTRLDIHKATAGYAKSVHCDRANRLCSLIVYFCDAEKMGIEGGDLTIHAHKDKKPVTSYERHPSPENAPVVATLKPKENLGVLFPCSNNSYHGVTAVTTPGKERDYLYINISGDVSSLW